MVENHMVIQLMRVWWALATPEPGVASSKLY